MEKSVFLILALVAALALSPGKGTAADKNQPTVVELESEGKVEIKPNKASFIFTIVTEAAQAEEAAKTNAKEAETFLAAIKKVLGPEDKVKTLQYQVLPIFRRVEKVQGKDKIRT
ncbi:MAG: SIMPL domain-containing protein, partial [Desulfobaccales bacterium]